METSNLRTRSYQLEMFERSMKENIIVAMDTGSGKTLIAVLRVAAELERCPTHQSALPAIRMKLLVGSDNVDKWSEQHIWDAALDRVRVVVSTHKILEDALSHAFVKLEDLALLVFDEAHHCVKKHPANQIMTKFYHPTKSKYGSGNVPHILGLTATPILRSKLSDIKIVEKNLDAITVSPKVHRDELFKFVYRPNLIPLTYKIDSLIYKSMAFQRLSEICRSICPTPIPYDLFSNLHFSQANHLRVQPLTRMEEQITKFKGKSRHILGELGSWATDMFIMETIKVLQKSLNNIDAVAVDYTNQEHKELVDILCNDTALSQIKCSLTPNSTTISKKVALLITFLESIDADNTTGIIFVQQRISTNLLSNLLNAHPSINQRFKFASFVGLSQNSSKRYKLPELLDLKAQKSSLAEFRASTRNMIIATNALEEGIDVQACNLVICFDLPQNLKSFVQRRGRARQEKSIFALMFAEDESQQNLHEWKKLELELEKMYQDASRKKEKVKHLENQEDVNYVLKSSKTDAKLTPDDTLSHLHHFCNSLPAEPFVNMQPMFTYVEVLDSDEIIATVTLPNCVDATVRTAKSKTSWKSEKAAAKDAAFHCYKNLHLAGLLNENLLPLSHDLEIEIEMGEKLEPHIDIAPQYNPWTDVGKAWSNKSAYDIIVEFDFQCRPKQMHIEMVLTIPIEVSCLKSLNLYWSYDTTVEVSFHAQSMTRSVDDEMKSIMRNITHTINRSTHSDYSSEDRLDFLVLFTPNLGDGMLPRWLQANKGRITAKEFRQLSSELKPRGFIRSVNEGGRPEIFTSWIKEKISTNSDDLEVATIPFTKRRNFMTQGQTSKNEPNSIPPGDSKQNRRPLEGCTVDRLPVNVARLNLLLGPILQHMEHAWMINHLRQTVLKNIPIKNDDLIIAAITPPSLQWCTNYESLEFIGDSVLKFVVSIHLYDQHKNWPEGYLSRKRSILVSNAYLANMALKAGLSPYIRTTPISWKKWFPIFISDLNIVSKTSRKVRMKLLADVVEALIGASFIDGGYESAQICVQHLLSGLKWKKIEFEDKTIKSKVNVDNVEDIIRHQFHNKNLVMEALTHPSCEDRYFQSYQRLEFLGDAIIDVIIASKLVQKFTMTPGKMTRIKSALANGHFLGFICLEFCRTIQFSTVQELATGKFSASTETEKKYIWQLMRSHSDAVKDHCNKTVERYKNIGMIIREKLNDHKYPWLELSILKPEKFFSDLIESLVGAIYVDSKGSIEKCSSWLDTIGFVNYLQRVINEDIDVIHPRTKLQWKMGQISVEYKIKRMQDLSKFECKLVIDGKENLMVSNRDSVEEAIISAAEKALLKLNQSVEV